MLKKSIPLFTALAVTITAAGAGGAAAQEMSHPANFWWP